MTWKVAVVDDHLFVADFLETVLSVLPAGKPFQVIFKARDAECALRLAARDRPDIWLLDLVLPDRHGFDLARDILCRYPEARILIFSAYSDEAHVLEAVSLGVHGFLSKGACSLPEIVEGLLKVIRGEKCFPPLPSPLPPTLSPSSRERQALWLRTQGLSVEEIAQEMRLSPKTVEATFRGLFRKFRVKNACRAIYLFLKRGWL